MKHERLLKLILPLMFWSMSINCSYAYQVLTLQIDSTASWVQDVDWIEILPDEDITPSNGGPIPLPYTKAIYHQGQRLSMSGSIDIILGRSFSSSIEIDVGGLSPTILPSGIDGIFETGVNKLKDGIFPNNTSDLNPIGICSCSDIPNDPFAPKISGTYDGQNLLLDLINGFSPVPSPPSGPVTWIGDGPPRFWNQEYSYHIEASVVPLPPSFILFLSGFCVFVLSKRCRVQLM